jgi:pyruvate-formate lyase-activating enzyme
VLVTDGSYKTDSTHEFQAFAKFINAREHAMGIEILPFHQGGRDKWIPPEKYMMRNVKETTQSEVMAAKEIFKQLLDPLKIIR